MINKVGVIGTQCVGKTTLIADMKEKWPQLNSPEKSYRDLIKEKKLPINKNGTKESQQLILNYLVDEAMASYGHKKMIFDRTPLDNLIYTLWLYDKGVSDVDEKFVDSTVIQVREAMKFYSVVFYLPFCKENDVALVSAPQRDIDPIYRSEIGHLFEGVYKAWETGATRFFDKDDCPAFVPIFGTREERIAMMSLYLNDKCEMYGEEESLITNPIEAEMLKKKFADMK